jgi:ELWxxDGT repeat protein
LTNKQAQIKFHRKRLNFKSFMKKKYCCFIMLLYSAIVSGQNPSLVVNVNTQPQTVDLAYGSGLVVYNNRLYFGAKDNAGPYLWSTDGTETGIYRDIKPGFEISGSGAFSIRGINFNGYLYYLSGAADTAAHQLWKSDGTQAGTHPLGSNGAYNFTPMNNILYFQGSDPTHGTELWRTDGTIAGTNMVKDIITGPESSNPLLGSAVLGNKILFSANYDNLYVTDGTAGGTSFLKGDSINGTGTLVNYLVNFQGAVYFLMNDLVEGMSLWKTDGTKAGTILIKSLNAGYVSQLCIAGDHMFFISQSFTTGGELWVSDGSIAGTFLLKDIKAGASGSMDPYTDKLYPVGERLYFGANDGVHGKEPWMSDGTVAGTNMITDLYPGGSSSSPSTFIGYNDVVLFNGFTSSQQHLFSTDGTAAGTVFVSDIPFSYTLNNVVPFNGKIYYIIGSAPYNQLAYTDGTTAGTKIIETPTDEDLSSNPSAMVQLSPSKYIFTAPQGNTGNEIWATDGTAGGNIKLLSDTWPEYDELAPVVLNGNAFLHVADEVGSNLWKSDGTIPGTVFLKNIQPDFQRGTVVLNNVFYFVGVELSYKFGLWRSDGTQQGTYRVVQLDASSDDGVAMLTSLNGKLYFTAKKNGSGNELWTSDGTAAGTVLVKDITPGIKSTVFGDVTPASGKLYFSVKDSAIGTEPWISDGTAAGTHLLKDIREGKKDSDPWSFTPSGNFVYFIASDKTHSTELWKTDGINTTMVKDITPGIMGSSIRYLTPLNNKIYFSLSNGLLCVSDGTAAGTDTVFNIGQTISSLDTVNQTLYIRQYNGDGYNPVYQLWRSDGTACRTQRLDFFPAVVNETANILLTDSNIIFLGLNSEATATELWKYVTAPIPVVEICNGYDDDCDGLIDEEGLMATITPSGSIDACDGEQVILHAAPTGDGFSYQWFFNGNIINGAAASTLSSSTLGGSVAVVINSSLGCTDTSAATVVNRIPLPKAKITPQGNLDICSTGSVLLKANTGTGYTYQWALNNAAIPGATKKQYTATAVGNYKVAVTHADGCTKTSQKITVVTSCRETAMDVSSVELTAFPNPFSATTRIDLSLLDGIEGEVEVRITDVSGKVFFKETFSYQEEIKIGNDIPNGFYLVEVRSSGFQRTLPVIKQ